MQESPTGGGILIVDDDETLRAMLRETLKANGYSKVFEASTGTECLNALRSKTKEIDLVLYESDLVVPPDYLPQLFEMDEIVRKLENALEKVRRERNDQKIKFNPALS